VVIHEQNKTWDGSESMGELNNTGYISNPFYAVYTEAESDKFGKDSLGDVSAP